MLSLCTGFASAANTVEDALGEVDIYNGGYELAYLSINGRVQSQKYTYYNYINAAASRRRSGLLRQPQSIWSSADRWGWGKHFLSGEEKTSDPK